MSQQPRILTPQLQQVGTQTVINSLQQQLAEANFKVAEREGNIAVLHAELERVEKELEEVRASIVQPTAD